MKAIEMSLRYDLRRQRATALTAAVLHELDRHTPDDVREDVHNALMRVFTQEGVDILTDYTRAEVGLPPRGPDGWTVEEMVALERARLEVIARPLVMPRFLEPTPHPA